MSERGPAAAPPAGMAVTDHQIAQALDSLLRETNSLTTVTAVVEQLQSKLGVNLLHKIDFIRSQIHHFHLLHSNFMPHFQHPKDHFAIHQNPNFPPAHLPPNFSAAQGYAFRPPPPLPPHPPSPSSAVNTPSTASAAPPAKESASAGKKRRGGPGGLNKLCNVSPLLQAIVGQPSLPRTEIVKQLWVYIRKHNLQDPNNKRKNL